MLNEVWILILLTLTPFLELRASIPYGILGTNLSWFSVFIIAVIVNIILGPIVYIFLNKFIHLFLRVKSIDKLYSRIVERTQKKIHKSVEKYGEWAIAIFIAIPLPGSGSYTGALAAYLIDLDFKKFVIANIIGVLIAAVLVTVIVMTGSSTFSFLLKTI